MVGIMGKHAGFYVITQKWKSYLLYIFLIESVKTLGTIMLKEYLPNLLNGSNSLLNASVREGAAFCSKLTGDMNDR